MPRDLPPGITLFSAQSSFHSDISDKLPAQPPVGGPGIAGNHHPRLQIADEVGGFGSVAPGARPHDGRTVANPRGGAKQDGNLPALGDLDGGAQ